MTRRKWHPGRPMTVFVLVMLPLVVALGTWQLQRAAVKSGLEEAFFARLAEPARPLTGDGATVPFARIRLRGVYDPTHHFLLDNQIRNGVVGYWVFSVFRTPEGVGAIVNRGFLAAGAERASLPRVDTPQGIVELDTVVWPDLGRTMLLEADEWTSDWPKRIQRLDLSRMAATLGDTRTTEFRLQRASPGVFEPAPLAFDFKTRMHQGYAAQWYGLGVVLLIGYLFFGFRRHD
ncbi:MAG: SURF1 family protein [Gammaproteobacteria bacterium]